MAQEVTVASGVDRAGASMNLLFALMLLGIVLLLSLSTLIQMLYMESLRLRTRETNCLQFFKQTLEDRIGPQGEAGALAFSILKHSLLIALSTGILAFASSSTVLQARTLIEMTLVTWAVMIVATYFIPQLLYRRTSGRWLLAVSPLLHGLVVVVRPLTALLGFLQSLAELGQVEEKKEDETTPVEEVEALISAGTEEGILEEEDRRLIHSVVAFGSKTVREVMTARPNVVSISVDATLEDLHRLVINEQFSRVPVHEGSIDQIVGFVHVRDMFEVAERDRPLRKVRDVLRPIRYVPETKPVNDLLREMQQTGAHMAVVVDEYGNTAGIATMEDMVEEILGEIRDEHEPTLDLQQEDDGSYVMSGSFDVDLLHELLEFRAAEDTESTTIGGLVTEWMGRVPDPGEIVEHEGIRIEVLAGNPLRVEQVRVSKPSAEHPEPVREP